MFQLFTCSIFVVVLQGSFLPIPDLDVFGDSEESIYLGEVLTPPGEELEINKGRATVSLSVTNMGDRPIQVTRTRTAAVPLLVQVGCDEVASFNWLEHLPRSSCRPA